MNAKRHLFCLSNHGNPVKCQAGTPGGPLRHLLTLCAALMLCGTLWALPNTFRFQGRLTDNLGFPVVGEDVRVRFALFSAPTGGSPLWEVSGDQRVATNDAGLFAADIGPIPAHLFAEIPALYLQVSVYDGAKLKVLLPRHQLSAVPYALHAETVPDNSVTAAKLRNKTITEEKMAENSIGTTTVAPAIKNYLIPKGMVAMFAQECPEGWDTFSEMNNRFPMGVEEVVDISTGGSSAISGLTTQMAGAHNHSVTPHTHRMEHQHNGAAIYSLHGMGYMFIPKSVDDTSYGMQRDHMQMGAKVRAIKFDHEGTINGTQDPAGILTSGPTVGETGPGPDLNVLPTADHNHTVASDGAWRPPYYGIIFCVKN